MAGRKNEAKIKFTADTTDLNKNINEAQDQMSKYRSEIKLNSEQMKTTGASVEGLEKNHALLQQSLEASQSKIESLNQKLEIAKRIFGEDSREAKKWQNELNYATAAQERLKQSIQNCSNQLESQRRIEAEASSSYGKLSSQINQQESTLSDLKRAYANVILEQGESSQEAQELKSQIGKLSTELQQNKQKLGEAENAAEQAARSYDDLGNSADEAGQDAESSADGYTVVKDVIANLATEAIQGACDKFKELSIEAEAAMDKMQARVGASEQDMAKYKDVVMDVYGNAYGESIEECTNALGTVVQMTDNLNEKDLKNATENVQFLADVYDMDYAESMRAVNSLTDQFGISQDKAFNLILQGAQKGLNQNGDLLDVINEYSVQFRNGGLSAEDMFNMIANGADEGVWSIDKMGDSFKEFIIGVSDGSANEHLSNLGLNADEVVAKFRNGGDDTKEAMRQIAEAIKNCDDKTLAYNSGVGLMGTMWEDMGQDACLALLNTEGEIDATNDKLSQAKTDAYDNIDTSLKTLGRTMLSDIASPISNRIEPVVNNILKFAIKHMDVIEPIILGIAAALGILAVALGISTLISGVQKAMALLNTTLLANPATWVVAGIMALVVVFVTLWNKCDWFRELWTGMWESVTGFFKNRAESIKNGLKGIGDKFTALKKTGSMALSGLKESGARELGRLKSIFDQNGGGIRGTSKVMWEVVKGYYKTGFNVLNTLTGGRLGDLRDTAAKKLNEFQEKFRACKEKIAKIFDFKLKMPDIKMPKITVTWKTEGKLAEAAKFLNLPGLPDFDVKWNALGAVLRKPTIFGYAGGQFQGGGEAGPEAVLPISVLENYIEGSMMKFITAIPQIDYEQMGKTVARACAENEVVLNIDSREAGRLYQKFKR